MKKPKKYIDPKMKMGVNVPVDIYITIQQLSKENDLSMSDVILSAIKGYFDLTGITPYSYQAYLREQMKEEVRREVRAELEAKD